MPMEDADEDPADKLLGGFPPAPEETPELDGEHELDGGHCNFEVIAMSPPTPDSSMPLHAPDCDGADALSGKNDVVSESNALMSRSSSVQEAPRMLLVMKTNAPSSMLTAPFRHDPASHMHRSGGVREW